jgi:hypothetical protein
MFPKEYLIILSINTIITVIVIFILFRLQDNKIRHYFKRLDRKLNTNNNITPTEINELPYLNVNPHKNIPIQNTNDNIKNDIDSYIDPLENDI